MNSENFWNIIPIVFKYYSKLARGIILQYLQDNPYGRNYIFVEEVLIDSSNPIEAEIGELHYTMKSDMNNNWSETFLIHDEITKGFRKFGIYDARNGIFNEYLSISDVKRLYEREIENNKEKIIVADNKIKIATKSISKL